MAIPRRQALRLAATGSVAVLVGTSAASSGRFRAPRWSADPFTLGVASGDPAPDSVVLWTRLAPDPLAPDGHGGMMNAPVSVDYEIAHDEHFRSVVRRGTAVATRELAHSVHPEIHGLEPDRWYHYRFRAGSVISPVGRTRTAPARGQAVERLRFAFASCQAWSAGYFTAYEHLAAEDLELVVHLGDYIYEKSWRHNRLDEPAVLTGEATDLTGYRLRYAQGKAEQPLRDAHAAFPWIVTFDDHEVDNNWAADHPGLGFDIYRLPALFRRRRAAAFQAMYEHQPLRRAQLPNGPSMLMHRRFGWGDLAELTMLDTRQYRSAQVCSENTTSDCPEVADPERSILGAPQRDWLLDGLTDSRARWQILGNQVGMSETDIDPGPGLTISTDSWDGYTADRDLVLGTAAESGVGNLVVITGDRHHNQASNLRADYSDPGSPVVAAEFTGTSITTGGNGHDLDGIGRMLLAANPDLQFFNSQRGYVRVDLDHRLWRNDFRVVPYIDRKGAPIHTRATYVVENGVPGVVADSEHAASAPGPAPVRGSER
ncbi:alkaline phosphatase D family protein [Nocardia higoensis]|uniref:Alkaline phosphatase D family protein n=1 Tax=Nocardia higoensis TaxID=228599 RepID=A0ABS0D912_9NOCA|nr:alkaline phosphatase D family protein [Nocardia higoensis]MBF6354966.1 alkaline phosphatase D family protein [Nocardia higoensis]